MAPASFPAIPGLEAAGVVDEVGAGVTGVAVGDEVMAWTVTGSYAEYALADDFALKPAGLGWETAAALPVAVETADRVLDDLGVTAGETLLVHGAAGAVGAFGVQLAVARGVTVDRHRVAAQPRLPALARRDPGHLRRRTRRPGPGPRAAGRRRGLRRRRAGRPGRVDRAARRHRPDRDDHRPAGLRAGHRVLRQQPAVRSAARRLRPLVADDRARRVASPRASRWPTPARAHELSETGHAGGKVVLLP